MVLEQDMNVKVVLLPEGEDPDSYISSVGTAAFKEYITTEAKDFILFKADLLLKEADGDPIKKTALIKDIVESIAKIPDPIKRSIYVKECARIMDVEEQVLIAEANRTVGQIIKKRQLDRERKRRQERRGQAPDASFPTLPPNFQPSDGNVPLPHWDDLTPPKRTEKPAGDTFQEKDIARILVEFGGEFYDKEQKITIAEYVLSNIEDVIDDFDNTKYKALVKECLDCLISKRKMTSQYFIAHQDTEMSSTAVDLLHSPYEFSPGWAENDIFLNTQKPPEENFLKDAEKSLKQFKRRKIDKTIAKNQARMKVEKDPQKVMRYMKVHAKLIAMRNELAKELGAVVVDGRIFKK